MKLTQGLVACSLALALAACGSGAPVDGGADGGNDAAVRNDRLNLNCFSAAGEEGAADCNARLGQMAMGATFFIGSRAACDPDPNNPACVPICPLTDINPTNCTFDMPGGCAFNTTEGYIVIVEAGPGRRTAVGVDRGDACPAAMTGRRAWGRVNFENLVAFAACARSMPMGGFGPLRFGSCPTPDANCGTAMVTPSDRCQTLMFMAQSGPYDANVCTRNCNGDADCGGRGTCVQGRCFARCGGLCALSCPMGYSCNVPMGATEGACFPNPPQ